MASATSSSSSRTKEGEQKEEDLSYKYPFADFECGLCGLKEKCFHGNLTAGNGQYPHEVYFMRDPFEPPTKKSRKLMLFDFLVIGATCHLCSRSVCIHKSCSIYFGNHFCVDCICRERRRFPEEIIQTVLKAQQKHVEFKAPEGEKNSK